MSRDETPDTTGLREGRDLVRDWLDDDERLRIPDDEWGRGLYDALRAILAAPPTPDASPDPAVVTPDAGDVPLDLRVAVADPGSILPRLPDETVAGWSVRAILASDWLANHVAAAREADRAPCRCVLHHCCEGCGCGCENESAQSNTFVPPVDTATDEATS